MKEWTKKIEAAMLMPLRYFEAAGTREDFHKLFGLIEEKFRNEGSNTWLTSMLLDQIELMKRQTAGSTVSLLD